MCVVEGDIVVVNAKRALLSRSLLKAVGRAPPCDKEPTAGPAQDANKLPMKEGRGR